MVPEDEEEEEDNAPLFYQPGRRGYYSPRQGRATPERLNAFRNVGRIIGLCLLQNELCAIYFNRHVIKYILRKKVAWHDLAFFDHDLYESLRVMVNEAESRRDPDSYFQALDLRFCIDLSAEEGGGQVELVPNGRTIEVNSSNVYDYIKKYCKHKMIVIQEKALHVSQQFKCYLSFLITLFLFRLQALRQGVFDILPQSSLEGLTAEDFRLLLNGVGEINVQQLMGYTTFLDESSKRKFFWATM
jgi:E3 ubiquitin-protein ligase EDD1